MRAPVKKAVVAEAVFVKANEGPEDNEVDVEDKLADPDEAAVVAPPTKLL